MPTGFTDNYVFEFHAGNVTMQHLISDDEGVRIQLCENHEAVGKEMWAEAFGTATKTNLKMSNVKLPKHPTKDLDAKKVKSLSLKYHAIPPEHTWYYPDREVEDDDDDDTGVDNLDAIDENKMTKARANGPAKTQRKQRKKKNEGETDTPGVPKKRKRGGPKNAVIMERSQRSIMTMFKPVTSSQTSTTSSVCSTESSVGHNDTICI